MTKLQKLGVVLLCWPAAVFLCGVFYAVTGIWLMAKGDAAAITTLMTCTVALMAGGLLASGDIK